MTQEIDLREIEKKSWSTYFEDGLWDIFIATLMLTMAIRTLTDVVWFTPLMFVGVLVVVIGKRQITVPRIGFVKFSSKREKKRIKLIIIIGVAVVLTGVLLSLPLLGQKPPKAVSTLFMAVFLMVIFSSMAFYMEFNRLYLYGLMFAVNEIVWGQVGEHAGAYLILIFGVAVMIIGIVFLVSFIQRYPLPSEEEMTNGL
jgi:hypothetical protein